MSVSEWSETAKIIADDCLGIKENDKILIVAGDGIEKVEGLCDLYEAIKEELYQRELNPAIMSYRPKEGVEPPALVEEACCSVMIPAWHSDSLLPNATVELDGRVIAKDGEYQV